ncbi:MAG: hypothetical protein KJ601_03615 [Nanoarchaeota archaeon]|nr:hypothetical protein [Nanoarchaeota archaeon]MBU1704729.1 hypothetical protein [Nanoarchaeota archaeon]
MRSIILIVFAVLLASLAYAECDLCSYVIEGCDCNDMTDDCIDTLCDEASLSADCVQEYCIDTVPQAAVQTPQSTDQARLTNLETTNKNEHNSFNIAINNLRTEVNQLKTDNGVLKDQINAINRDMQEKPSPLRQNLLLYIVLTFVVSGLFIMGIANSRHIKKITKPEQPKVTEEQKKQIINYIHTYSPSYSHEQIIAGLKQQGFNDEQIKAAHA